MNTTIIAESYYQTQRLAITPARHTDLINATDAFQQIYCYSIREVINNEVLVSFIDKGQKLSTKIKPWLLLKEFSLGAQ